MATPAASLQNAQRPSTTTAITLASLRKAGAAAPPEIEIINLCGQLALPLEVEQQVLRYAQSAPSSDTKALLNVCRALSRIDTPNLRVLLTEVCTRRVGGQPFLSSLTATGTSVIAELDRFITATQQRQRHPNANWLADPISDIIGVLADDYELHQNQSGDCGAVSSLQVLQRHNPAEVGRLMMRLVVDGSVTMAGGEVLFRDDDSMDPRVTVNAAQELLAVSVLAHFSAGNLQFVDDPKQSNLIERDTPVIDTLHPVWQFLFWLLFPIGLTLWLIRTDAAGGLEDFKRDDLLQQLTGRPYDVFSTADCTLSADLEKQLEVIAEQAGESALADAGICISISYEEPKPGCHQMQLVDIDRSSTPPAIICRSWDLRRRKLLDPCSIKDATVYDPKRSLVRIPLAENTRIIDLCMPS